MCAQSAPEKKTTPSRSWLDRIGLWGSVACMIHCMAMPFAVGLYSVNPLLHNHWLDAGFFLLALFAVLMVSPRTRNVATQLLLWGGLALFGTGMLFEADIRAVLGFGEVHLLGSILIIVGHWRNLRAASCAVPRKKVHRLEAPAATAAQAA